MSGKPEPAALVHRKRYTDRSTNGTDITIEIASLQIYRSSQLHVYDACGIPSI